jgi:hypothetical protein
VAHPVSKLYLFAREIDRSGWTGDLGAIIGRIQWAGQPSHATISSMRLTDPIIARSRADAARPKYHFCAPAGWMNDPNGMVFYGEQYGFNR